MKSLSKLIHHCPFIPRDVKCKKTRICCIGQGWGISLPQPSNIVDNDSHIICISKTIWNSFVNSSKWSKIGDLFLSDGAIQACVISVNRGLANHTHAKLVGYRVGSICNTTHNRFRNCQNSYWLPLNFVMRLSLGSFGEPCTPKSCCHKVTSATSSWWNLLVNSSCWWALLTFTCCQSPRSL